MRIWNYCLIVTSLFILLTIIVIQPTSVIGEAAITSEDNVYIGYNEFYSVGETLGPGPDVVKITIEYESSAPIDIWVTTNWFLSQGFMFKPIEAHENITLLANNSKSGKINYITPDSSKNYFLLFVNPNNSTLHLYFRVEFFEESEENDVGIFDDENFRWFGYLICGSLLIAGIVIIIIIIWIFKRNKAKKLPIYEYPVEVVALENEEEDGDAIIENQNNDIKKE